MEKFLHLNPTTQILVELFLGNYSITQDQIEKDFVCGRFMEGGINKVFRDMISWKLKKLIIQAENNTFQDIRWLCYFLNFSLTFDF